MGAHGRARVVPSLVAVRRLTVLMLLLALLAPAAPAGAQDTPFGPVPTEQPTVEPAPGGDDTSRSTLLWITGAVVVAVVGIGYAIARDARRSRPADERDERRRGPEEVPGAVSRKARERARRQRAKAKAARRQRRHNRSR